MKKLIFLLILIFVISGCVSTGTIVYKLNLDKYDYITEGVHENKPYIILKISELNLKQKEILKKLNEIIEVLNMK